MVAEKVFKRSLPHTLGYILGILCILPFFSHAQEIDYFSLSLEELLNTKVTGPSRSEEVATEAPSSVTVFTREEIQRMGVRTLNELAAYVPGYYPTRFSENGLYYDLLVRGSDTYYSSGVLILMDGIRLNDNTLGSAAPVNSFIPIEHVERVEFIRGPGSALYGANAFVGAINIVTCKDQSDARVWFGSNGSRAGSAHLSLRKDRYAVSASVSAYMDNGETYTDFKDPIGREDETSDPRRQQDVYAQVESDGLQLTVRHAHRANDEMFLIGNAANHINRAESGHDAVQLKYRWTLDERSFVDWTAGYAEFYQKLNVLAAPDLPRGDVLSEVERLEQAWNVAADATHRLNDRNTFQWGLALQYAELPTADIRRNYDLTTGEYFGRLQYIHRYIADEDRALFGIYAQDRHVFTPWMVAYAGVRADNYSDFGWTVNPRGALILKHPYGGELKCMYGEAFRAPSFYELYLQNNVVAEGNPGLDPEKIRTVEVGLSQRYRSSEAVVTFFHNEIDDILTIAGTDPQTYENMESGAYQGWELELKAQLIERLLLRGAYTVITRESNNGIMPENFGAINLNYNWKRLNLNAGVVHRGGIEVLPEEDPATLLNASAQYRFSDRLSVQCSVRNVLDEAYHSAQLGLSGSMSEYGPHPNRGREWLAGLTYYF